MNYNKAIYNLKSIALTGRRAKSKARKRDKLLKELAMASPLMVLEIQRKADKIAYSIASKRLGAPVQQRAFKEPPTYRLGMGKEFYQTRAWRDLRYQVLTRYGARCQCCGEVHGYIHVDHIKPRSTYPALELDAQNLQILCEACNIGKSNKDATDWRVNRSVGVALAPSTA